MPLPQQNEKYTYQDYLAWPEEERWEIIEGVPHMQAAPSTVRNDKVMKFNKYEKAGVKEYGSMPGEISLAHKVVILF